MNGAAPRSLGCFCVLATLVLSVTGCATYRVHPEFKERHQNIANIAVMAPQVDAYLLTFKGDKNRLDYISKIMEKAMVDGAEYTFSQKRYGVKKLDLSEKALASRSDLRTALFNVNKLFDKALNDMKMGKQSKFTYTIGPDVNTFADLSGSDALIFMRASGFEKDKDEITKEVVKAVAVSVASAMVGARSSPNIQTSAVAIEIAVIDANDGAVLWYNFSGQAANYSPRSNWQVSNLTRALLLPFPDRAANVPVQRADIEKSVGGDVKDVKTANVSPVAAPVSGR